MRLLEQKPEIIRQASVFNFQAPSESKNQILKDFKKSKKYSMQFLRDLEEGLANSDYFK